MDLYGKAPRALPTAFEINSLAHKTREERRCCLDGSVERKETKMRNVVSKRFHVSLIAGWAILTLSLASSAMAASDGSCGKHRVYREHHNRVIQRMLAQDFDHFDFDLAHPTHHSEWSGSYEDGKYPGYDPVPPAANGG
jgi:hypothetical protein